MHPTRHGSAAFQLLASCSVHLCCTAFAAPLSAQQRIAFVLEPGPFGQQSQEGLSVGRRRLGQGSQRLQLVFKGSRTGPGKGEPERLSLHLYSAHSRRRRDPGQPTLQRAKPDRPRNAHCLQQQLLRNRSGLQLSEVHPGFAACAPAGRPCRRNSCARQVLRRVSFRHSRC